MALKKCHIVFDCNEGVFYSGEIMRGSVYLTLDEPKKIKDLEIKLKGGAICSWTETYSSGKGVVTVYYVGSENYFTSKTKFSTEGYPIKDGCVELPAGNHKLDFCSFIPPEALTSYEGVWGRVRYTAKVTLSRPGKLDFDQKHKVSFTVLRRHDLNMIPNLSMPVNVKVTKNFHTFFVKNGHVEISAILPYTGYVPGQSVNFQSTVKNVSNVNITELRFRIKQLSIYKVTSPMRKQRRHIKVLSGHSHTEGLQKGKEYFHDVTLYIPACPPSSDVNIPTILPIAYYLQIKVVVSGMHKNYKLRIPLQIGTTPLMLSVPTAPSTSSAPQYGYYDPPTYEEVELEDRKAEKKEKIEEGDESNNFAPRYPVFRHFQHANNGPPDP